MGKLSLILIILVFSVFWTKGTEGGDEEKKQHFVLVHGASHGGWCWYKLITLLEKSGRKVTAVDLSGAGISLTDSNTVFESDDYNRPLFSFLSALPPLSKVILVGHSVGGGSVTEALCKFPDKISMAVYLAADMTPPGGCQPHQRNKDGGEIWEYIYGEGADKPPTAIIMKKRYIRRFYYNQSPLEDVVLASKLLRPAPFRALQGLGKVPASTDAEKIPRVYIKTAKDNLFDPVRQDRMVKMWPPSRFYVLNESDHSAFFSAPDALFDCLVHAVSSLEPRKDFI
ncbi:PREDICTED: pheophorbidase isoform X3 [Tarenaya hassleriana]|uniref:pheophorbidase isoform X3 n=1 Tax=Tarenaya hassleriana TaxID=28532 RepID=UPI00053C3487|nr:PREDICTED: pheophorbidase isoform X3 [Tarenaya hassleriana]